MPKNVELNKETLQRLIREEKKRINESLEMKLRHPSEVASKTKEVDAKNMANVVAACVDQYKRCSLKEAKLKKHLKAIQEAKASLKKKIIENLD